MNNQVLTNINSRISDRSDSFYWQTDRKLTIEEAALIWKSCHSSITNEELLIKVNKELKDIKLSYIKHFDESLQGGVNSIRVGVLTSGEEVIIRCHPKGLKNGYFFVESLVAKKVLEQGIPSYKTYIVHELQDEDDIAFQVIQKLDGVTVESYLQNNPEGENDLVYELGKTMSKLHQIKVKGFGPFDNDKAKNEELIGIHITLKDAINAGLDENLNRLVGYNLFSQDIADKIKALFENSNLFDNKESVLIHNDFADWNLLTDGKNITGLLDWDECVAGDPLQDIACWSLFFEPKRLEIFLKGYYSIQTKPDDFETRFQLMRLRYTISKMALRLKRYNYEKTDFLKIVIENGKKHLDELLAIFNLDSDSKIKNKL